MRKGKYISYIAEFCRHYCQRLVFVAFLFIIPAQISGQGLQVPIAIQAALIQKVIKFDNAIGNRTDIVMLIIYDNETKIFKNELISQLPASYKIRAVLVTEIEGNLDGCDLAYIMPGVQSSVSIIKARKILTITGLSKYVESGDVSIGFGLQNDKPKIFVNMTSLKTEERILAADILRIAKVYK